MLWRPWSTGSDVDRLSKQLEDFSRGYLDPTNLVKRAIPPDMPIEVTQVIPRLKDGGAFVKFTHPREIPATQIEGIVHLELYYDHLALTIPHRHPGKTARRKADKALV